MKTKPTSLPPMRVVTPQDFAREFVRLFRPEIEKAIAEGKLSGFKPARKRPAAPGKAVRHG